MEAATKRFDDSQKQRVNRAIADAESRTSAEIVPVVATSSGRYDRPEDIFGLWLGVAAMVVTWLVLPESADQSGDWGALPAWVQVVCLAASVVVGFVAGALIAGQVGPLRRLLTPRAQMEEEVTAAAHARFHDSRVHHTEEATGVIIYISLFERMASIVADRAVLDALSGETVQELVGELTARLRDEPVDEALCETISDLGRRLAEPLPRAEDDRNELPDGLVLID